MFLGYHIAYKNYHQGISMGKLSLIRILLLCCSVLVFANSSSAVQVKDEVDVENVKAPPRDVKDILLVLNQARTDKTLIEKATKILALPVPNTSNTEVLNHYYYRRASAEETLENSKGAFENLKKAAIEYPSFQVDLRIDEMFQYAQQEALRGNTLTALKTIEEVKAIIPQNLRGWNISMDRQITQYCLTLGDFDCARTALTSLENNYSNLISTARQANYLNRLS